MSPFSSPAVTRGVGVLMAVSAVAMLGVAGFEWVRLRPLAPGALAGGALVAGGAALALALFLGSPLSKSVSLGGAAAVVTALACFVVRKK